jgi:hypothetical protein
LLFIPYGLLRKYNIIEGNNYFLKICNTICHEMGGACSRHEIKNVHKILVGKPQERRPLGKLRRRWEDNIRMDLGEIGWEGMDWMRLVQDRGHLRLL